MVVFLTMLANSASSSTMPAILILVFSSVLIHVLALPALPLSLNLSPLQQNTTSAIAPPNPRPPQEPTCPSSEEWGTTLGHPTYDDCDYILSRLYPKDPMFEPVLRNFYAAPADVSHTMSNFRLPYEESYGKNISPRPSEARGICDYAYLAKGTCNIQLLLATDFNNVPNDEATWNDLRGATRTIFRTCIRGKGFGGVVVKNGMLLVSIIHRRHGSVRHLTLGPGKNSNIEIVVYGKDSIFAKNQILKYSSDQLARSIAAQELLQLLNIVIVPVPHQPELDLGTRVNPTVNATTES